MYFTAATMVIAVPTGIKIFVDRDDVGRLDELQDPDGLVLGFLFMFTVGVTGVVLANGGVDTNLRYLLCRRALPLCALARRGVLAVCRFLLLVPKMSGGCTTSSWAAALLDLLHRRQRPVLPQHFLGQQSMPRRCIEALPLALISSYGYVHHGGRRAHLLREHPGRWSRAKATDNPWGEGATTLEWTCQPAAVPPVQQLPRIA